MLSLMTLDDCIRIVSAGGPSYFIDTKQPSLKAGLESLLPDRTVSAPSMFGMHYQMSDKNIDDCSEYTLTQWMSASLGNKEWDLLSSRSQSVSTDAGPAWKPSRINPVVGKSLDGADSDDSMYVDSLFSVDEEEDDFGSFDMNAPWERNSTTSDESTDFDEFHPWSAALNDMDRVLAVANRWNISFSDAVELIENVDGAQTLS